MCYDEPPHEAVISDLAYVPVKLISLSGGGTLAAVWGLRLQSECGTVIAPHLETAGVRRSSSVSGLSIHGREKRQISGARFVTVTES